MSTHAEHTHEHTQTQTPEQGGHEAHDTHQGAEAHEAHDAHAGHAGHGDHVAQFRRLFWWNLLLAIPVIAFSMMFAMILGYELPSIPGIEWVSPVLGTVIFVWGGARSSPAPSTS